MTRSPAAAAQALFVATVFAWILWALHVSRGAVPGLLDDGTHLIHSDRYRTDGFLATVWGDLAGLRQHARFYEVQYALLGLYNVCFGHDLAKWYFANHLICLTTSLLIYAIVMVTTRSNVGAALGALVFLTSSPIAEATRANFGKAEVVMTFLFVAGLPGLVLADSWPRGPDHSRWAVPFAVGMAVVAVLLAAVSKESGRLFGLSLVMAALLGLRAHGHGERRWLPWLAALGTAAWLANVFVFWSSRDNPYLKSYFSLDFSTEHLLRSAAFYATQNGDVILMAIAILPWMFRTLRGERTERGGRAERPELFLALYVVAALYTGALLAVRFQLSYYLYVPSALVALAFGWGTGRAARRSRNALVALAAATRLYSVPYNAAIAEAQRSFDRVNYEAMERVRTLGPSRVLALDMSEESQFVQEWNLLRWFSFDGGLAPLYGTAPFFESWSYQDDLRAIDGRTFNPTSRYGNLDLSRQHPAGPIDPRPGDLVAVRSGTIQRRHLFLRGVMPMRLDGLQSLPAVDTAALEWAGAAGGPTAAQSLPGGSDGYRWDFFRLVSRPRFLLLGRDADGWMRADARVRLESQPPATLTLTIEVPGWLPFAYPLRLRARHGEDIWAALDVPAAGTHRWTLPLGPPGVVQLQSDQWFQPSALGIAPDTRTMSYRITGASLPTPGADQPRSTPER